MVRFKNRYLLCAVDAEGGPQALRALSGLNILHAVRASLQDNFGDVGTGTLGASLAVKYWSSVLGLALVRASRDHFRLVWASLSMITRIEGLPEPLTLRFRVIHVGGTIRSCQKSAVEYMRPLILAHPGSKEEIAAFRAQGEAAQRQLAAVDG